jgi:hypothetical protein
LDKVNTWGIFFALCSKDIGGLIHLLVGVQSNMADPALVGTYKALTSVDFPAVTPLRLSSAVPADVVL